MSRKNHHYSSELKYQAVGEYLKGQKTLDIVCKKYGILSDRQLRNWIKMYNSHTEFKSYTGGSRMTKGRSTTYEERIALVRECIEKGYNYGEIAEKYKVGYQQIYTWVKKYKEKGEAALKEHHGRHKKDYAPQTEEERLKLEVAALKRQLYLAQMENDVLKKLQELERGNR